MKNTTLVFDVLPGEGGQRLVYTLHSAYDPAEMLRFFDLTLDGVQKGKAGKLILEGFFSAKHGITPFVDWEGEISGWFG